MWVDAPYGRILRTSLMQYILHYREMSGILGFQCSILSTSIFAKLLEIKMEDYFLGSQINCKILFIGHSSFPKWFYFLHLWTFKLPIYLSHSAFGGIIDT